MQRLAEDDLKGPKELVEHTDKEETVENSHGKCFRMKFPSCLCGISARQLELFLWKAKPDSPKYLQDCTLFFTQLNNVNK